MASEIFVLLLAALVAVVITLLLEFLRFSITRRFLIIGGATFFAILLMLILFFVFGNREDEQQDNLATDSAGVNMEAVQAQTPGPRPAAIAGQASAFVATLRENRPDSRYREEDRDDKLVSDGSTRQTEKTSESLPPVTMPAPATTSTAAGIIAFLTDWQQAWEKAAGPQGDTAGFAAYYAAGFTAGGQDRAAWLAAKARTNTRKSWIKVKLSAINISPLQDDGTVKVSFRQNYSSSNFSETSDKNLILRQEESGWKIISVR